MNLQAKVFKTAAEIVLKKQEGHYEGACIAINLACKKHQINFVEESYYANFFSASYRDDCEWPGSMYWFGTLDKETSIKRSTALLLCAELVK